MSEQQIERVRRLCLGLPETSERLSHGEPTFFVQGKKVFADLKLFDVPETVASAVRQLRRHRSEPGRPVPCDRLLKAGERKRRGRARTGRAGTST